MGTPRTYDLDDCRVYQNEPHSAYATLMRNWPGLPPSAGATSHVIRRTPRDYETFRRMREGDCYPEALAIAWSRYREELSKLKDRAQAPAEGSPEQADLRARFVPPYPEHIFRQKWRKLISSRPAWTVPAHLSKDAYSHIHYAHEQARAISVREAARLQS